MFIPGTQVVEVCQFAVLADREIRSDLVIGMIKDENDYTSNFTGALRRNINSYSQSGLRATSFMLPTTVERKVGCDATIVISNGYCSKIATFEAKWPRVGSSGYKWDYAQTGAGKSHYSDQLDRQINYAGQFAIFEIFYCELPFGTQPKEFPDNGSACAWHSDAISFKNSRPKPTEIWDHSDLQLMLSTSMKRIDEILLAVCACSEGRAYSIADPRAVAEEFRLEGEITAIFSSGNSET